MRGVRLSHVFGVLAAGALACGALACGSSSTAAEDDAGADGAAEAEGRPDGGESTGDAGADGAAPDAKPVVEAGTGYCASLSPKPKLCDDFDDLDLTDDWTASAFVPGSVFELDDASFTSGPASFHLKTPATAASAAGNALLRATLFGAVTKAKLSFAVLLPKVTFDKGTIALATLYVASNHSFGLYLRDGDPAAPAAILEEYVGGGTTRHLLTKLPTAGAWTRVVLDLDLGAGKANLTFDGQKALDDAPLMAVAGTEAELRIGTILDGPADAFEASYDDVVLDF